MIALNPTSIADDFARVILVPSQENTAVGPDGPARIFNTDKGLKTSGPSGSPNAGRRCHPSREFS